MTRRPSTLQKKYFSPEMFFFIHFKNIYNIYVGFVICIHFFTKKQTNKDTISTLNIIIHHKLGHLLLFFHTHLNSSKNLCNNGVQVFLSLWGQLVHNVGKSRQTQIQVSANMLDFLFDLLLRLQGIKGQVVVSFKFLCVRVCVVCGCGWGKWNSMW